MEALAIIVLRQKVVAVLKTDDGSSRIYLIEFLILLRQLWLQKADVSPSSR